MTRPHVPAEILDLAHQRRAAREAQDWTQADGLRASIEAGGWTVIDRGVDFDLRPLRPPDVIEGDLVRYGSSAAVPSRLGETASAPATVILVATDRIDDAARLARTVQAEAMDGTQVIVVADGSDADHEPTLATLVADEVEVVRTAQPLGSAGALNAGVRRARGAIVIILGLDVEVTGDIVLPLEAPFRDPGVGVAGGWGVVGADAGHLDVAPTGDVDAVDGSCLAFRRMDFAERGPLDERFRTDRHLDTWWSLVLRDEGKGAPPRRATTVDLPATRPAAGGAPSPRVPDRAAKRDFYRLLDRFGGRTDLLSGGASVPGTTSGARQPG